MVFDPSWFVIEQIKRVVESMNWTVVGTETKDGKIKVILEKPIAQAGGEAPK